MIRLAISDDVSYLKYLRKRTFHFIIKKSQYWIPIKDIVYFSSEGRRICVVSLYEKYYFYDKLDAIHNKMLKKENLFIRIHKSYLVNVCHIKMYEPDNVIVIGNERLPISRSKKVQIKNILQKMRK